MMFGAHHEILVSEPAEFGVILGRSSVLWNWYEALARRLAPKECLTDETESKTRTGISSRQKTLR